MGSAATLSPARFPLWLGGACLLLAALVVVGFAAGKFPVAPGDVLAALWASLRGTESGLAANVQAVITQVRAPRVAAALAVGAALSAAGASYQGLFRNPLVSPDILGVSAGCALGAAVGILAGMHAAAVQLLAFGGGMAAVGCVVGVAAAVRGRDPLLTLILSGIVVGSLFGAGVALAKYLADPFNALPSITFWLLGSFAGVMPGDLGMACALIAAGLVPLALLRWRVDVLALSDDEARSLGLRVGVLRLAVIAAATLATAAAVSIAGTIGWIGLVIPHAARLAAGAAFARVLPLSIVTGAAFMLAVDTLCRTFFAEEIPPGVVMAFVGTPAFVALMAAAFRRHA